MADSHRAHRIAGRALRAALMALYCAAISSGASAVTLTLDYTYDTTNFFGAGNPSGATAGAQARAAIEAATSFYSDILEDEFTAVTIPPDFHSSVFNSVAFWDVKSLVFHPTTGELLTVTGQTRAANEYRIYVGARDLGGTTLGFGGPTSGAANQDFTGPGFTQEELDQIIATTAQLEANVDTRGQGLGFAALGGVLTFDRVGTVWHYNHTTAPSGSVNDFYSVAIHELGHALGLGASDQWDDFSSGETAMFLGPAAGAVYGTTPPLNGARDHWAASTMSTIFGTNTPQEAAMDPQITQGTRKVLTNLDAAALTDLGWEVAAPTPNYHPADFNQDTFVNGGDFAAWKVAFGTSAAADADDDGDSDGVDFLIWQRSIGASPIAAVPEPGGGALAVFSALWLRAMSARNRPKRGA